MSRLFVAIAIVLLPLAQVGWAQSALFDLQIRPVSELEIANGAPAGAVLDLFVSTDRDMNFVSVSELIPHTFYQNELGTNTSKPSSLVTELYPAVGVDSWFTSPGSTSLVGDGFQAQAGTGKGTESAWFDFADNGSVTDFQFGRLTTPTGTASSLRGEIWLRGGSRFPFELFVESDGEIRWNTFDPILPESGKLKPILPTPDPIEPEPTSVVITPTPEPTRQSEEPIVEAVEPLTSEIVFDPVPIRNWIDLDANPVNFQPIYGHPINWGLVATTDVAKTPYNLRGIGAIDINDTRMWDVGFAPLPSLGTSVAAYDVATSLNVVPAFGENEAVPEPSSLVFALLCMASPLLLSPRNRKVSSPDSTRKSPQSRLASGR